MLTVFDQPEDVQAAIAAGVSGFIVKNGPIEDLLKAIRVLHEGKKILSPEVTNPTHCRRPHQSRDSNPTILI